MLSGAASRLNATWRASAHPSRRVSAAESNEQCAASSKSLVVDAMHPARPSAVGDDDIQLSTAMPYRERPEVDARRERRRRRPGTCGMRPQSSELRPPREISVKWLICAICREKLGGDEAYWLGPVAASVDNKRSSDMWRGKCCS
jgi:hypothetical protein